MIKPCPDDCLMDWADFHKKLDMALAHLIDETGALPSKTSLMTFMVYANAKRIMQTPESDSTKEPDNAAKTT